ncbi:MAG: hypothetical protein KAT00_07535 [Planctomycetes bacterium]|nr:hypothetical protein [Planctomycetota bacterium]
MTVVNSEFARNVGLNGRVNGGDIISVELLPGLNNVTEEQMEMLLQNETFELFLSTHEMSIATHDEPGAEIDGEQDEPDGIGDIDITAMTVAAAGRIIGSAVTMDLLDKFLAQEMVAGEFARKGILGAITKQRADVQKVLTAHEQGKKKE